MKRRIPSLLIVLCLVCGMIPAVSSAKVDNGLEYEVYADHVEITGYSGTATEVVIPDEIEELPVTAIDEGAFSFCDTLTSISIPVSVTSIGDRAFVGCIGLSNISIPDSLTSIGDNVFWDCFSLTSISIPASVTSIGDGAFHSCSSLASISIPDSLTSIGDGAFHSCSSLTSISLPDSVTFIGDGAFYDCSSLASISIPDGVTSINDNTFSGCSSLISISVPNSVTSIGMYAFFECSSLNSFSIPDSVISIDNFAFLRCSNLTSISIPASVTNLGALTFIDCSSLSEIVVDENNPNYSSDNRGVLFDKEQIVLLKAPDAIIGSYSIPGSVTTIGFEAFDGCSSLASISIPDSITSIGGYAFNNCTRLSSITIPDSVTSINDATFSGCSNLTSISIPDSVTEIGYNAFEGCSSLTSITIPNSVTYIGEYTFSECSSLTSINIPDSVTEIGHGAFSNCSSLTSITIPDSVKYIYSDAFAGCSSLLEIAVDENNLHFSSDNRGVLFDKDKTKLIRAPGGISGVYAIPDGVTDINGAFYGCSKLTSISIPDSVTYIGRYACFLDCSNLIEIVVDKDNPIYSSDNRGVLFNKEKTELIQAPIAIADFYIIPNSVTKIGSYAFENCTNIADISIPNSVTEICSYAFSGCSNLTNVSIPDSVAEISLATFSGCSNLTSISIPDSVTKIGADAFFDCINLSNITIPNCVKGIYDSAFSGCSSLTSITIPDSVIDIGSYAFSNCSSLTSIRFLGDAPSYNFELKNIFPGVTAIAYYPSDNSTWTKRIMRDCGGSITWIPYNPNNPFTDVPIGSFYEAPVLWALENNITTGASADSFNPNGECLRAQVVTFLHRSAENPEPASTNNPFTDVKSSDFFYKPVLWAVEEGITNGISATEFGSYDVCNRAAVVTFLWRAAGSPEPKSTANPFTDVKPTDFFYKPVLWAVENGITNGLSATEFGPTAACNRAQVVTFLYRAHT